MIFYSYRWLDFFYSCRQISFFTVVIDFFTVVIKIFFLQLSFYSCRCFFTVVVVTDDQHSIVPTLSTVMFRYGLLWRPTLYCGVFSDLFSVICCIRLIRALPGKDWWNHCHMHVHRWRRFSIIHIRNIFLPVCRSTYIHLLKKYLSWIHYLVHGSHVWLILQQITIICSSKFIKCT